MNPIRDTRRELISYLRRAGWHPGEGGVVGELWRVSSDSSQPAIAVPYKVSPRSDEFAFIVRRLAAAQQMMASDVTTEIEREFQDVQHLRIDDPFVLDASVLLGAASTMLSSARRLYRAAATTARKPRASIGSNFSAPADEIASFARLAHTRQGSFVLPVVMPVEPPLLSDDALLEDRTQIESAERRVTRTLAMAVAALDSIAVRPDREATPDDIAHLVQSGVSRELVAAVRAIAVESGVQSFDSRFQWAGGLVPPGGIPERVVISADASPLLARLEKKLRQTKPDVDQSLSGQIIEIRQIPGALFGEIAIHTIRNNRQVEVRISCSNAVIKDAHDWAKQGRALIVRGVVVQTPGRPLAIPNPDFVKPIDTLFESDPDTANQ